MKRVLVLLLFLFLIPSIFAVESSIKSEYKTGETLISSFTGFTELKSENILFYSGRAYTPLVYDLAKIQDSYYLYAQLPFEEKNITLKLLQAKFIEQGQEVSRDLEYNFLVRGNISDFSVSPGFIITNKAFQITIKNYDKPSQITTSFQGKSSSLSLIIGEEKTLTFDIQGNSSLETLTISSQDTSYKIPVQIFQNATLEKPKYFKFTKSFISLVSLKDSPLLYQLYFMNTGDDDLSSVDFSSDSDSIKITPSSLDFLKSGEIAEINLTITLEESKNMTVVASYDNKTSEAYLFVTVASSQEQLQKIINSSSNNVSNNYYPQIETCSSLNGRLCSSSETCSVPERLTIEGLCCLGSCQAASSGSSTWLYVIIIIIVLGLIGFFVYKRLKIRKQTSKEILKAQEKSYESRFKPQESRGNLTRI